MNNLWILVPLILAAWLAAGTILALLIGPVLAVGTRYDLEVAAAARREASRDLG